jgi:citrate synthase
MRTSISKVTEDDIIVRGHRLAQDLVGRVGFIDAFFLQVNGRMPSEKESKLLSGLMVNSMDHGINHPVLVARLTYGAAPEAIQNAIAAGILGTGSVLDGAIELAADMLYRTAKIADTSKVSDDEAARQMVASYREQKRGIPGLGHPMHKTSDPRTERLFQLAQELGFEGRFVRLIRAISEHATKASGRQLPINGAAAVAALYCELGFPAKIAKAVTIVSLSAGVVGHLMEEMSNPLARDIRKVVKEAIEFGPAESAK